MQMFGAWESEEEEEEEEDEACVRGTRLFLQPRSNQKPCARSLLSFSASLYAP